MTPNDEQDVLDVIPSSSILGGIESEEIVNDEEWKNQKKHIFILSTSGKPIYSRYGNEDKLVTLFGVMQALVSFVQSNNDTIRCIRARNTKYVFLVEEPLIIVTIARTNETETHLFKQLKYVYYQIVSILTSKQLKKIYEQRKNFDLRRLLSGSERLIDHLLNFMSIEPGIFLNSIKCLPLQNTVRNNITQTILQTCSKIKNIVFILLIGNNKLISFLRIDKYYLNSIDLNIVLNLINSSESFKTAESWTPICLPKFDENGFLHAHVSYLSDDCQACLLLLTVDKDIFFVLSEAKQKLVEKLRRNNCLEFINEALTKPSLTVSQIGITEVRHFIYKCKSKSQYWCPEFEAPYTSQDEVERVFSLYQLVYDRIHSNDLKLIYESFENEVALGWVSSNLELFVIFEPLITKDNAIKCISKILSWVKREEDKLFILNDSTF